MFALSVLLAPSVALAQPASGTPDDPQDIIDLINKASGWFFAFIMALAVIMLLYAAFLYLTAAGSEERVARAKTTITYAVIGIAVALLAGGIPRIVQSFFD